ncbi:MAG: amino acid permease [Gammaproteobacteria bacterium]|nr:amino acid permease [Gammaproteobacteria bacterium]
MTAHHFTPRVALAVIIANMIGTGVFTSLGFQLADTSSGFVLLMLWVVGGAAAFCGAMCYAELGARLPRSGGEYNFLTQTIHPALGFVSGWISATIGFAAPTALVAITFGKYLHLVVPAISSVTAAIALVVILSLAHASNHRRSGSTQFVFTVLKISMIVGFSVLALFLADGQTAIRFVPKISDAAEMTGSAFAVSLIYVSYSYSGWNAATYFSDELENPQRSLPWVLLTGCAIVTALYVLLNFTFLWVAPADALRGQIEIVYIAAAYAFGDSVARVISAFMSLLLISTVSAMILAAPRVLQTIGQDFRAFRWLSRTNEDNIPYLAVYTQAAIALLLILTATFESILVFSGFILALNTFATVVGLFVLRRREAGSTETFRVWAWPLPAVLFLCLTGWIIVHIVLNRPVEALAGAGIIVAGFVMYYLFRNKT